MLVHILTVLLIFSLLFDFTHAQGAKHTAENGTYGVYWGPYAAAGCSMKNLGWVFGGKNDTVVFSLFMNYDNASLFTPLEGNFYNDNATLDPLQPGMRPTSKYGSSIIPDETGSGSIYVFGGFYNGVTQDLWRYDFIGLHQEPNPDGTFSHVSGNLFSEPPAYGTTYYPGGRYGAASWMDQKNRQFYIFGGQGYVGTQYGYLNDLWMYDIASNVWTWIGGSNDTSSNFGALWPARRMYPTFATVNINNVFTFYLFGGGDDTNYYSDLWVYNPTTKIFKCLRCGPTYKNNFSTINSLGIYNTPGGRESTHMWVTNAGNQLVLYGGKGFGDNTTGTGVLADQWVYTIRTNEWFLVDGPSNTTTLEVNYNGDDYGGDIGSRQGGVNFVKDNQMWLFAGADGNDQTLNDLWYFNPITCGNLQRGPDEQCDGEFYCTGNCLCNEYAGYTYNGSSCIPCSTCPVLPAGCGTNNGGCDYHTTCSTDGIGNIVCSSCPQGFTGNGYIGCLGLCGNGVCESGYGEDCVTCAADCGSSGCNRCGDGFCTNGETCSTCYQDCAQCKAQKCNPPDCSGHGKCSPDGVCSCDTGYSGSTCSSESAPISVTVPGGNNTSPIVTINPTVSAQSTVFAIILAEIREVSNTNRTEASILTNGSMFTLQESDTGTQNKEWFLHSDLPNQAALEVTIIQFNDPSTSITFANTTTEYGKNSVKFKIQMQNWPFRALSNSLEFIFNTVVNSNEKSSSCSQSSHDSLQTLSINVDGVTLYGQFESNAEVDGVVRRITYTLSSENSVVATAPHFWDTLVIDPDFGLLLESAEESGCSSRSSNSISTKVIVAIAVPVGVFVIALVVVIIIVVPRLHMKVQVSKQNRRSKTQRQSELGEHL